ncbi:MAG: hypothetical protein KF764_29630 [Labilithrix sp.]|nr:hypothetical protein [Labilithrix sp.]MBX3220017.1 hypothetical protein [Labilithrix sp.]
MARATTLFVATDEDLVRLFVAVRHALEQPITTVKKNPVMHQLLATSSWDPGEDDEEAAISSRSPSPQPGATASIYAGGGGDPIDPVVSPESRPAIALEETAPLRLRALPHAAVVGITGLELEALTVVLLGEKKPPARIVEPLDDDGFVDGLPTEALAPLAELTDDALAELVTKWNAALRITRRKAEPSSLVALRALAREAIARGGHVFTHMPL